MSESQGFLSRWSKRRERVEEEEQQLQQQQQAEQQQAELQHQTEQEPSTATAAQPAVDGDPQTDEVIEPLPDPDSIEEGGSFAAFMGDKVDPETRTAALRKLWQQPHFNEVDGLAEYALDYSDQPLLSAEVSAQLVEKVFKYVVEDEEELEEDAEQALADTDTLDDDTEQQPLEQIDQVTANNGIDTPLEQDLSQSDNLDTNESSAQKVGQKDPMEGVNSQ
ncbi:DUF3306 domain-containing protein [Paraferrimonas haliotis]|uniref:DUF3306 domain-containing protein n=1 Tax=Paraferrimonas haliotis TaxID=2013866 RepID=UPI000BA9CA46|nr:DUF3306 domain-containing protein [Paraferrimonas haliotis]